MKRHVYRIGDKIRVVNPKWVKRVGYPLVWMDLEDEVRNSPITHEALKLLGLRSEPDRIPFYLVVALAKLKVEQRGFGGDERSIHYEQHCTTAAGQVWPGFARSKGQILTVVGKRVAKTGKRWKFYGGEDGDEGGLDDMKTHIILKTESGEIEACNVEPV